SGCSAANWNAAVTTSTGRGGAYPRNGIGGSCACLCGPKAAEASVAAMISGVGSAPFACLDAFAAVAAGVDDAAAGVVVSPPRQNANTATPITATAITARTNGFGP